MKILIINNDRLESDQLALILSKNGYLPVVASYDDDVLSYLTKGNIQLVILYLSISDEKGIKILGNIRGRWSQTELPVMAMGHTDSEQAIIESLEMEANDFLSIPFNLTKFFLKIKKLLQLHKAYAEIKEKNLNQRRLYKQLIKIFHHAPIASVIVDKSRKINNINKEAWAIFDKQMSQNIEYLCNKLLNCSLAIHDTIVCGSHPDCTSCIIHQIIDITLINKVNLPLKDSVFFSVKNNIKTERWFTLGTAYLQLHNSEHVIITLEDVSYRKTDEIKLRASEEKYRSLFEQVPVGLYQTSEDGNM